MNFAAISGQDKVKKILRQAFLKDRIPSAYLFVGPDSEVKAGTAVEFAKLVNCSMRGEICGNCENCVKIERGVHPDILVVKSDGSSIKIDQIRELTSFTRYGPAFGKLKVVIVDLADYMTTEAYASFLKTLEEPADNVLFILLTSRGDSIPDTVASRCQKVIFSEVQKLSEITDQERDFFIGVLTEVENSGEEGLVNFRDDFSDTEEVKGKLNKFMIFLWQKACADIDKSKVFLDAVKIVSNCYHAVERHANLRLALDVMFLNLKEVLPASSEAKRSGRQGVYG